MTENPIRYQDLISPDDSIEKLIGQLEQLQTAYTNMANGVKSQAASVASSLKQVSGATEQGRKAIQDSNDEAKRLERAYKQLDAAYASNAKEIQKLNILKREANQYNKQLVLRGKEEIKTIEQIKNASYQQLSAQYSLNKMYINNLTAKERDIQKNKEIIQTTKAIYEQMKKLQADTGKMQLNVGNYPGLEEITNLISSKSGILGQLGLSGNLMATLTSQTAMLTAAVTAGATAVGMAAKQWYDYNNELARQQEIVSVTLKLQGEERDAVIAAARSIAGVYDTDFREVINAANILMMQFGETSEDAMQIIRDGMQGMIRGDGGKLLSMIQQYAPAFRDAGVSAKQLVAVIHNSEGGIFTDQNMNAIVMGIKNIRLMTKSTSEALAKMGIDGEEMTRKLNDGSMSIFDALKQVAQAIEQTDSSSQAAGEVMQQVFGRQGAMAGTKLGEAIASLNLNLEETKRQTGEVGESLAQVNEASEKLEQTLIRMFGLDGWDKMANTIKYEVLETLNFTLETLENIYKTIDNIGESLGFPKLVTQVLELIGPLGNIYALLKAIKDLGSGGGGGEESSEKPWEREQREMEEANAKIRAWKNPWEREQKTPAAPTKTTGGGGGSSRRNSADQALREQEKQEQQSLQLRRKYEDLTLELIDDQYSKEYAKTVYQYDRQIEDLKIRLEKEKTLTVDDRKVINDQIVTLEQVKEVKLAEVWDKEAKRLQDAEAKRKQVEAQAQQQSLRDKERAIRAEYDIQMDNIDMLEASEKNKTQMRLQAEKERLQKLLALYQQDGKKLNDAEIQSIQSQIAVIDNEMKKNKKSGDLYDMLGFNFTDEQKEGMTQALSFALDNLNQYMDAVVQAADKKRELADQEVERAQSVLEKEIEARNNGYANEVETARKELENAKKNQQKAIEEQRKAQKAQAAIQALEQIGNLVSATALIWKQVGFPWAIPAIAIMWGSFAAAKIKAAQLTKQNTEAYGEGTVELLQGGSHQSGNDIDLGRKPNGTRRRAEGGEFFAVINKRNSRR